MWVFAGLCLYGAFIELGQALLPYRTAEWADLGADALGSIGGFVIAALVTGGWCVRAESWLQERFG